MKCLEDASVRSDSKGQFKHYSDIQCGLPARSHVHAARTRSARRRHGNHSASVMTSSDYFWFLVYCGGGKTFHERLSVSLASRQKLLGGGRHGQLCRWSPSCSSDEEAAADLFLANNTMFGDTRMTPHKQYGGMLCFSAVVFFPLESSATTDFHCVEFSLFMKLWMVVWVRKCHPIPQSGGC